MYSFNIFPLLRVIKRYNLDRDIFFDIIMGFLSHRREEILNLRLYQQYGYNGSRIKEEIRSIIYQLVDELNCTDNVEGYFIKKSQFYIKDQEHVPDEYE